MERGGKNHIHFEAFPSNCELINIILCIFASLIGKAGR